MERITTATGKQFDVDLVCSIPSPPFAYIRIINSDLATVNKVFSDENETKRIEYNGFVLNGYTTLGYAKKEDIAIKVRLEANG